MCSLDLICPIVCSSSWPHSGHWNLTTCASTPVIEELPKEKAVPDGCWLWGGARQPSGTAVIGSRGFPWQGSPGHKPDRATKVPLTGTNFDPLAYGPCLFLAEAWPSF